VSSRNSEDFGGDLLAAKERDLEPLLDESTDLLDLDYDQTIVMEDSLTLAWCSGMRSGHAQLEAKATQPDPDLGAIAARQLKSDFKSLMLQSADRLNLTTLTTISMWSFLHQAWMAGNRTSTDELMRLYIEVNSDVPEEARQWLEEREKDEGGEPGARSA
jgi:hypothetical protein